MFSVLQKLKGSPKFWQTAKYELIAKVKQLGPFHIFFTFSCGEMRWSEVFLSLFKRKGLKIEYPENWDDLDEESNEKILVDGVELWDYVNNMADSKHKLFKDYSCLITRHFDARVKSFLKNILMAPGRDIPFSHYSYRVEFQARGMPHIHGVAWITKSELEKRKITGYLCDHKEAAEKLAAELVSCQLPNQETKPRLHKIVTEVQKHHHTKSCTKKSGSCRFGFPRLPSPKTFLTEPLAEDLDETTKKELIRNATQTLTAAKELLDSPDCKDDMTFKEFLYAIGSTEQEYMQYISISQKGKVLILKRNVSERFINNYNEEMIYAWNANIDIQLALDPFAVISYIVNYVSKDESGMTAFLKEALKATANKDVNEKLKAMRIAYLTHRQMGSSEAVYRVVPSMKLKDSNVTCTFVSSGFPENRSVFYRKIGIDDKESLNDDDDGKEAEQETETESVTIQGRQGTFKKAISVIERYAARPKSLDSICLAQFSIYYTPVGKSQIPKYVKFSPDGSSEQKSHEKVFDSEECLPKYLDLNSQQLGYLRLRSFPAVLRIHSSKKKEGHQQHYSEILLFSAWRNEEEDIPRELDPCLLAYQQKSLEISRNRKNIYPGESLLDLLDGR